MPIVSYVTSKGINKSRDTMTGVDIRSSLTKLKALRQSPSNSNFTSFLSVWTGDEKYLINL